jgi:hypothetical protein
MLTAILFILSVFAFSLFLKNNEQKIPGANTVLPHSTGLTFTSSLHMKGRVVGITTTHSRHPGLHVEVPSTSIIRFAKIPSMSHRGDMWSSDFWLIMLGFGLCIVISCGIRQVGCRWRFRSLGMRRRGLVMIFLG